MDGSPGITSYLRTSRNCLAPINQLPPECISPISVAACLPSEKSTSCFSVPQLGSVCKYRRDVNRSCAMLWASVSDVDRQSPKLWTIALASWNGQKQRRSRLTVSACPMCRELSSWNAPFASRRSINQVSFGYSRTFLTMCLPDPRNAPHQERERGKERPSSRARAQHPHRKCCVVEITVHDSTPLHQPITLYRNFHDPLHFRSLQAARVSVRCTFGERLRDFVAFENPVRKRLFFQMDS
ncbi:hypothetical protein BJ322DRAFT_241647 [Thelephora terrestris]|uniref:Uncharacterized protein n=1 Tax=Thelephora terrestris TaxID=56493 RepID=A0A9P6L3K0_9AGAM|nr:hypothetical protein BJ322DRAFT_241647 [Thelephora terrestris]